MGIVYPFRAHRVFTMPSPFPMTVAGSGRCYALWAYDVGLSINLDGVERSIAAVKQRGRLRHKRRAPEYFEYQPPPLRITHELEPFSIGDGAMATGVELVLFDFGAVSVAYSVPFDGPFDSLLMLSECLYENAILRTDSRRRVEELLAEMASSVERPSLSLIVEDYYIFHLIKPANTTAEAPPVDEAVTRILRAERGSLAPTEIEEAMSHRLSFGTDDLAIIDWNATLMVGAEMEDVYAVIEFANVELLEMRYLDHQLDSALDQAYEALSRVQKWQWRARSFERDLRHIAQLQVESAVLFERVTNTVKLLGDQYLARLYRHASLRFHLEAWDAGIQRKLQTLNSIYGKMADRAATRRMEVLEWIIIVLIAFSIVISLWQGLGH